MGKLQDMQQLARNNPEQFWGDAAKALDWVVPPKTVLQEQQPNRYRWFVGGSCNTCYNALDRHVANGRGDQIAIYYDSPVTETKAAITYNQLHRQTAQFAGVLASQGVAKGDRVIIYMPMIPQALVAMLACARLGAIHSVVFGGFAAKELATRIDHATPKVLVTASCGIEPGRVVDYKQLVNQALELASHKIDRCIVYQRQVSPAVLEAIDIDFEEAMSAASPHDCVTVEATDPLYILYTSGTTGQPKGVVRDNGGHMVAMHWTMKHIYNVQPGDVYWAASDIGWIVGHSYIVYAPLIYGCSTVLFEGKPVGNPDAGAFWRVVQEYGVKILFTAPTAIRAIKREDPEGAESQKYDLSSLQALFLAGERADPDTVQWSERTLNVPVIDHWWQTETGWAITADPLGIETLPIKPGSSTKPVPGYDLQIVNEAGEQVPANDHGAIVIQLPLPPGTFFTLWQADDRYVESYLSDFPGYYKTGDSGYVDDDGYVFIMSRIDDIINVAGHRLSSGAIEEVLANLAEVAECAVIGINDSLKGQVPLGLLVLKKGVDTSKDICATAKQEVRNQIGPVAAFKQVVIVERLPKTRSGKILRATMRKIANGEEYTIPPTIDDPVILDEIARVIGSD